MDNLNQRKVQQRPALQTRVEQEPHPSTGRGFAYSQDMRTLVMNVLQNGDANDPLIQQTRETRTYPSRSTESRWLHRLITTGDTRAYRRTGQQRAEVLCRDDLLYLALYRICFPKATAAELNAFLYRANYGNINFRFYSNSQITEAELKIFLSRKKGSTTAYQALLPINIQKRDNFYNLPHPLGIADIRRDDMIDLDECGLFVESSDRKWGKTYIGKRCRQAGPYQKSCKYTLLLAISGDDVANRWYDMWKEGGTTNDRMITFIERILQDIGPGTPQRRRCFTMDNLSSHHADQVAAMIHAAGHRLAFRAPYYAVDGPIEYTFNTIQGMLAIAMYEIRTEQDLVHQVQRAIQSIQTFAPYFVHCGF